MSICLSVSYTTNVSGGCLSVGPWFVGEVLAGHVGACFVFGFVVNATFIPTVLTYVYGAAQVCLLVQTTLLRSFVSQLTHTPV